MYRAATLPVLLVIYCLGVNVKKCAEAGNQVKHQKKEGLTISVNPPIFLVELARIELAAS